MEPASEKLAAESLPSDLAPEHGAVLGAEAGRLAGAVHVLGAVGLLGATAADALAVAGRHTGLHLLGSIELVQACVVLLAVSAMFYATLTNNHAGVHIVTERLSRPTAARLARVASVFSALTFLTLAAGSAWVLADLWNGYEQTELLRIPLRWLRLLWVLFALAIAARFIGNALRKAAA